MKLEAYWLTPKLEASLPTWGRDWSSPCCRFCVLRDLKLTQDSGMGPKD